ncbi:MAG: hypothetical protein MUF07_18430 [Steroidobacteraceae bacterium]|nr:hypothetical protein [Steroidobacteraceae bacterium]
MRNGCRGLFQARLAGGGGNWGGGGAGWGGDGQVYSIKCQSIGGRWGACPVDIGGRVRLAKKESHAECVRGWTWGTLGREASGRKAYDGAGDAPPGIQRRREE